MAIDASILNGTRVGFDQVADLLEQTTAGGVQKEIDDINTVITAINNTVLSGTYTPTLTNTTNISASTSYAIQYMRVGSVVTVSGQLDADAIATGNTVLGVSLPIASTFSATYQCGGAIGFSTATQVGGIYADTVNNRALFRWQSVITTNAGLHFTFTYRII